MMNNPKHTFFCEDIDLGHLSEDEAHHAARVLRIKEGDSIRVIDGKGRTAICAVDRVDKKQVSFSIEQNSQEEVPALRITIAIAPTKNIDRFQFFLEKVTEIGVSSIIPIITEHSERTQLKTDKLRKNLVSAIKQSGHGFLPELSEPISFSKLLNSDIDFDEKYIAHCDDDSEKNELKTQYQQGKNVIILIGPEGDFSKEEIILAKERCLKPVSLGKSRLRTETAGIVACHTLHVIS